MTPVEETFKRLQERVDFTYEDCQNPGAGMVNYDLALKQKITRRQLFAIKDLHRERSALQYYNGSNPKAEFDTRLAEIDIELRDIWGFPQKA